MGPIKFARQGYCYFFRELLSVRGILLFVGFGGEV